MAFVAALVLPAMLCHALSQHETYGNVHAVMLYTVKERDAVGWVKSCLHRTQQRQTAYAGYKCCKITHKVGHQFLLNTKLLMRWDM